MIKLRKSHERGHANHGWLDSYHTFSFSSYYDPNHLNFRSLRVINEDWINPSSGFGTHGHKDMEIITYVLEGSLEHKDSIGNGSIIQPGEVQRMSAGTGIYHSEYNPSTSEKVHLLQIWILPEQQDLEPSYEQKSFPIAQTPNHLHLVAARGGKDGAVTVHQDMSLYAGIIPAGEQVSYELNPQRYAWLQVAKGAVELNGVVLNTSDAAAVSEETRLDIKATQEAEILLFDLA
ncbi:pirin family protein [Spirulina subsalsa]|uniref:pirin family protein n=1 Tax=Spirulina subsalsa TaxID=54311 RepID=UPI0002DBFF24|nr:pirin family protein [Spirulina subsalsa]